MKKTFKGLLAVLMAVVMFVGIVPFAPFSLKAGAAEKTGDDGTVNWDFIEPVAHQKTVPGGYKGIYTAEDLNNIRNNLTGKYILMNDIDLSSWGNWTPIGDGISGVPVTISNIDEFNAAKNLYTEIFIRYKSSEDYLLAESYSSSIKTYYFISCFTGIFNGNGYVINNMTIDIDCGDNFNGYTGLIGKNYGIIKNIGILKADIKIKSDGAYGYTYAGGISGYNCNTSIENCYFMGKINATGDLRVIFSGGVTGYCINTIIKNSYNMGNISAASNRGACTGGIVGNIENYNITHPSITNCYNAGKIKADLPNTANFNFMYTYVSVAGGIAGSANEVVIICCYNSGEISSHDISSYKSEIGSGGIVGSIYNSTVKNCFNIGSLYSKIIGGIVGYVGDADVENCYNAGKISLDNLGSVGAIIGYAETGYGMGYCYCNKKSLNTNNFFEMDMLSSYKKRFQLPENEMKDKDTFKTFDFDNIWDINADVNNGYPFLRNIKFTVVELTEIKVEVKPSKLIYNAGEAFDMDGMVVKGYYSNYIDEIITDYNVNIKNGAILSKAGTQTVSVTYQDKTDAFNIDIIEKMTESTTVKQPVTEKTTVPTTQTKPDTTKPDDNINPTDPIDKKDPKIKKGDINDDGSIDAADARLVLRYVAKLETFTDAQKAAADLNGDGAIDASVARRILRYAAKLEDKL